MFKPFSKLDDPLHLNVLGVGIGLSLWKQLSLLLHGNIYF